LNLNHLDSSHCSAPDCTHDCAELRHQIAVLESKLDIFHLQLALKLVPRRIRRCMNRSNNQQPPAAAAPRCNSPPSLPTVTTPPPLAQAREPTVSTWLRDTVGLPQHQTAFFQNDLTSMLVVKMLTDADLKEIGISLGHRKLLLAAIAKLNQQAGTAMTSAPHVTASFANNSNSTSNSNLDSIANSNSNSIANANANANSIGRAFDDDDRDLPPGEC
jgi:hypothetical protein